ncbi:MAG: hypothetical protein KAS96_01665 [Planctomycetes bacterium]|nr:hypothetical protein [Planctomycetota bacterium]
MRIAKLVASVSCLFVIFALSGCFITDFVKPEGPPKDKVVAESYLSTQLKVTDAAEVLNAIHLPEHTVLSQSSSVIAASGQKIEGYKNWFNMVAFDEDQLTATRKYIFTINEKPKILFNDTWPLFLYDSECVLPREILDEPYADESSRRIAVLEYIKTTLAEDMSEVKADNKELATLGMVINQTFGRLLVKLKASPALATKLDDEKGLEFHHINMEKGKITMVIEDDIAVVKMRAGSNYKKFKDLKGLSDREKEKMEQ